MTVVHGMTGFLGTVAELTIHLEKQHHRVGWDDMPASLYVACREERTDAPLNVSITPLTIPGMWPDQALSALAEGLSCAPELDWLIRLVLPPGLPVAVTLVSEGWGNDELEDDPDRLLADIPGSFELRFAATVCGRHQMHVERRRDHAPKFEPNPWSDSSVVADLLAVYRAIRRPYALQGGGR